MDYMENPIITRATDLAILNSDALYKCDAKEDLANCFFPVHFTEAYDIAMKNSVNISHSSYIKDAAGVASQNKYDASQSDHSALKNVFPVAKIVLFIGKILK